MSDNWILESAVITGSKPTVPGDELTAIISRGEDTKILTWTRDSRLTHPQFLAMVKRELKTELARLNTTRPIVDVTPDVQPSAAPESHPVNPVNLGSVPNPVNPVQERKSHVRAKR